ncbi:DUF2312 domain-containing protein [Acetobacter indonesiensis]|uniref:GapR-like DNA-binding domain-containing protein n=1 Tax=Acetobacter indonesiensis TaxID=104101 RepID=A0A252AM51_9PROT|nr:DUF2312 domain-containing protein [Acetobacter indonesiensis]OUI90760.1 hypothetical protein HK17_13505 [Acetobacter indonesiensis]
MSEFPSTHNEFSGGHDAAVGGIAADRLRSFIERWERMDEEKKAIASDQKDIMLEAKSAGYDCKVIRQIIQMRKKDPAELDEMELILETYKRALGM